jgi:hypothetical protein
MQKYANLRFKPNWEVGWHIDYANILHSSLMDNTSNFLIVLPKPTIEDYNVASSPTTFTQWYLAFVKMLKGTKSVLLNTKPKTKLKKQI